MSSSMSLEMGTLLKDRFRLLRPLGEGGMGEVYLGEDERGGVSEGRPVAIKALRTELNDKHELFLRRFQEEIEILRRLNEPGIPAFVDAFEEQSRSFFVMEYVEGHSLELLLDRSPLGLRPDMVAEVGIQVLKILEALHNQSPPLIHRDIKPANLIIRRQDDLVFLVDFGLAREFHSQAAARTLVGTVGYCPLEQLQGQPEPRSDLYALGATLFELLTGQIPKPLSIPPVCSVQPDVPESFGQLVDRSVRQDLDERFPDAATMRKALEEVCLQMAPSPARPKKKRSGSDRADHLLTSWGRTLAEQVSKPNPVANRRRWKQAGIAVLLLSLVFCGVNYRTRQSYLSAQRDLAREAFAAGGGVPGPGWELVEACGLFPAKGLGLGDPNGDATLRSGAIFENRQFHTSETLRFRLLRLKGRPRLLVFCQPWGILLEPRTKNYQLRLIRVARAASLESAPWEDFQACRPLSLDGFNSIEVRLSIAGGAGQIQVGGQTRRRFTAPGNWRGKRGGVVLLNAVKGTRCLVEGLQLR
ncbi:serine/threonine protein kinase [bacterium]|nr:serine/threonine protein kinase [bacterium]